MKIVFCGSAKLGLKALEALKKSGDDILCVITQPDKARGRGLRLEGTPIKEAAAKFGLKVYQPQSINSRESIDLLRGLHPDLFIVIAYGQLLSQAVLDIPRIFCLNIHASLLPKYRGAAPINWALINAEKVTGLTAIKMVGKMDAGPIIAQQKIDISDEDSAISLEDKLSEAADSFLLAVTETIGAGKYELKPQGQESVSFAPKLKKEDGLINWNKSAAQIYNLIRGVLDWPGAFTYYKGKLLKIYKAKVSPLCTERCSLSAGEVVNVSADGIAVAAAGGNLVIEELQIEGSRVMPAKEFLAGHRLQPGEKFQNKK
jgi:methionyl-tRNA formyltransferase